jgi:hypothetical protein
LLFDNLCVSIIFSTNLGSDVGISPLEGLAGIRQVKEMQEKTEKRKGAKPKPRPKPPAK